MALVNARCIRCNKDIQLDEEQPQGFCLNCGSRIATEQSITAYLDEHPKETAESKEQQIFEENVANLLLQGEIQILQSEYDVAEITYSTILTSDPTNKKAQWGLILARTRNLSPIPLKNIEDFFYGSAAELFATYDQPEVNDWKVQYAAAFEKCCYATVDAVDLRVFVELEIYKWYPQENAYLYPVSRTFDLEQIFDKILWSNWYTLRDCMFDENAKQGFVQHGKDKCKQIWDYFEKGFQNLEMLKEGRFDNLYGTWQLKLTTGNIKADVLNFSQNPLGVVHLETCRLKFNHYDYYRFVKFDTTNRILAAEHRHFPSSVGMGGDYIDSADYEAVLSVMAVYDYILVMPTALYIRVNPEKIPGYDRALQFQQKCRNMPCFQRTGIKSAIQIKPIFNNHETAEVSRKISACYIATAVYGSEEAPQVLRLRQFRDETLHKTKLGRNLSSLYYILSPTLANKLRDAKRANKIVRKLLDMFVNLLSRLK